MVPKKDIDEATTFILLTSLPNKFHGLWYTSEALAKHLQDGGIRGMDKKTAADAMHSPTMSFSVEILNQYYTEVRTGTRFTTCLARPFKRIGLLRCKSFVIVKKSYFSRTRQSITSKSKKI
jgi:hypothetical protein